MSIRGNLKLRICSIYLFLRSYRKGILTLFVLGTMGISVINGIVQGPLTELTLTLGTLILATDYKIIRYISESTYDWIESPDESGYSGVTIESALEMMEVNYKSKEYSIHAESELDIVEFNGEYFGIDSRNTHQHMADGMIFNIKFVDNVDFRGQTLEVDRRLGYARVEQVKPDVSQFRAVRWMDPDEIGWSKRRFKRVRRNIMAGNPEERDVYVEFELSSEVENSDISELERAYKSVRTIYDNRGALT